MCTQSCKPVTCDLLRHQPRTRQLQTLIYLQMKQVMQRFFDQSRFPDGLARPPGRLKQEYNLSVKHGERKGRLVVRHSVLANTDLRRELIGICSCLKGWSSSLGSTPAYQYQALHQASKMFRLLDLSPSRDPKELLRGSNPHR